MIKRHAGNATIVALLVTVVGASAWFSGRFVEPSPFPGWTGAVTATVVRPPEVAQEQGTASSEGAGEAGLRMPVYARGNPPQPRSREEVLRHLRGARSAVESSPLVVVLVAGPKDHGPGEHDYPNWQRVWARLLARAEGVRVRKAWEWPSDEDYRQADVVVFYKALNYTPEQGERMERFLERGGGLVFIHWAVHGGKDPQGLASLIGMSGRLPGLRYRHGPVTLEFSPRPHPITRNFRQLRLVDETYWNLVESETDVQVLATSEEEGQPRPQIWTVERPRGRVFVSIPGHYAWSFDDPLFRLLLLRGIAWAAHQPVDRFNELIWPGARVAE